MEYILIKDYQGFAIKIYGTCDEPLLESKDVARLIDIMIDRQNVKEMMNLFNFVEEKTTFLSEQDVCSLLVSQKTIIELFKKWMAEVRKDVKLQDLEKKLQEKDKLLKLQQQELSQYKDKTYEEIQKNGHLYIIQTDGGTKVGKTKDVTSRMKGLQTANVNTIKIILDFRTSNPDLLEKVVHYILDRYRCNSNREFFDCNVDYIKTVVTTVGKTIDTLKSTFHHIPCNELEEKLTTKLGLGVKFTHVVDENTEVHIQKRYFDWFQNNVTRKDNNILHIKHIYGRLTTERLNNIDKCVVKQALEGWIKKTHPDISSKFQDTSFNGIKYKGWLHLGFSM
jgi:hypothetical protein